MILRGARNTKEGCEKRIIKHTNLITKEEEEEEDKRRFIQESIRKKRDRRRERE